MAGFPLEPGATIGILGGGQLGRMLVTAATELGFDVAVLSPRDNPPDARVAVHAITAAYDDDAALQELAELSDVITFEFENVPARALERLAELGAVVAPGPKALAFTQDRVVEKDFVSGLGIDTVDYVAIDGPEDIPAALERLGAPALLKTRREGYDGKGQVWIRHAADAADAFAAIGAKPAILEAKASFVREISVIAARGHGEQLAFYPVGQNTHRDGILKTTLAPAPGWEAAQEAAEAIATKILEALDYVGVLGVELFELDDGRLLVNEIAPRVHNTGHWTMDGTICGQFEQHIRAVAGWPLGSTQPFAEVEMENLLGDEVDGWPYFAAEPGTKLHFYGKGEARPGRKMGHLNRLRPLPDPQEP